MNLYEDTYLATILNDLSQSLLIPAIVGLLLLIAVTAFLMGQTIVEYFTERRHYRQNMPAIVNALEAADYGTIVGVIDDSLLLRPQQAALITAARNMGLSEEALFSLAPLEIARVEKRYDKRLAVSDTISKIAPLMGLMATLIPLGPGIVAMGQGEVDILSRSLLVAFDATVCGLVSAVLALIVSKVRSGWYGEYVSSLESVMGCVVDRASEARAAGVQLPFGYEGDPLEELARADKAAKASRKASRDAESRKPGSERS